MTQFAFVFPGQGSQYVGMGRALAESSPEAAAVFATADAALGEPISRLAWEGPEEDLNRTEQAQPALLAASIAYLAALVLFTAQAAAGQPVTQPTAAFAVAGWAIVVALAVSTAAILARSRHGAGIVRRD